MSAIAWDKATTEVLVATVVNGLDPDLIRAAAKELDRRCGNGAALNYARGCSMRRPEVLL